ncbi:hypothetical protein [Pseudomonas fluorescens]|uniref:hypothetical protein n=1 Tax=Pseudomonas fluorescens TaxID=294 RepID=UPI00093786C2|nr:hypothetical protein [Pseudomonas fluorescens]
MHVGNVFALCIDQHNVAHTQHLKFHFGQYINDIEFALTWLHKKATIGAYDRDDTLLNEQVFLGSDEAGGKLNHWVKFTKPEDKNMFYIKISVSDYCFVDFFKATPAW